MERNRIIDSTKFILIFFVVFIHTFEYDLFEDRFKLNIYITFSTFLMPLFIAISGYLSKGLNWGKYKVFFIQFSLTYLVFQYIYASSDLWIGTPDFKKLLIPIGPLWYIVGLLFWRFLVCIIIKFKIPYTSSIPVSLIISLALGFVQDVIPISRIFVFIPFFLIGYYIPIDFPVKIKKISKLYPVLYFAVLSICVSLFCNNYQALAVFCERSYATFPSISYGFFNRLLFFPLAILSSIAAYVLMPGTFHKFGGKSLSILLLHVLLLYPVYRKYFIYLNSTTSFYIDFLAAIVITFICIWISNIKQIQYLIDPIRIFGKLYKKR